MSLDILAKHVASQGRGRDSALVHMSPREVSSLRALAKAHGGDLSVNPKTGLPEAGFLEDILPAVAGFALDSFAPGLGEATGLGAFAAPALVGGVTALTNGGDWQKGLMAGLGAYGGASLSQGMGSAAAEAAQNKAWDTALAQGMSESEAADAATAAYEAALKNPSLSAGFEAATGNPKDFLKDNKWGLLAAGLPAIMGSMGGKDDKGGAPAIDPGNIRPYDYDPRTQRYTELPSYKAHYADGGGVDMAAPFAFANPANYTSRILQEASSGPKTGGEDSKAVYDYLMGRGPNPYLIRGVAGDTSGAGAGAGATTPGAAATTPTAAQAPLTDTNMAQYKGGNPLNQSYDSLDDPFNNAWGNLSDAEKAAYYAEHPTMAAITQAGQKVFSYTPLASLQAKMVPDFVKRQELIAQGINPDTGQNYMDEKNVSRANAQAGPIAGPSYEDRAREASQGPVGGGQVANPMGLDPAQRGQMNGGDRSVDGNGGADRAADGDRDHGNSGSAPGGGAAAGGLMALAVGGPAGGGIGHLGGYSDGGRLLKGPGDGVSDDIPATIGHGKEPARLADGEFVVPARIVSELGNGSTEAGARKLYAMMDRIQKNRRKTVGKNKVAVNSKAERFLPA